jgi:FkbM family methyltransferase
MRRIDALGASIRLSGMASARLRARFDLWSQRRHGDFSPQVVEHLVRPDDVVLDIGARFGTYTLLLARIVGPHGVVHAFEPNPQHSTALGTIACSRKNVVLHPFALSDRAGVASLHIPVVGRRASDGLASLAPPAVPHRTVQIHRRRLDDLSYERIDFVKCDVEGHELGLLHGGEATLRRLLPPVLVEIERRHAGADLEATLSYLEGLGYNGYAIYRDGLRSLDQFDVRRDQPDVVDCAQSGWMPSEYIHDFLFAPARIDITDLIALDPAPITRQPYADPRRKRRMVPGP